MIRLCSLVVGVACLAASSLAVAQTDVHRPTHESAVRAGLMLVGDTRADDGFGVGVDYDIPVADGGPGRLLLGPSLFVVFADESRVRNGCDVDESERLIGALGTLRYVVDIHPRLRPWARFSLGIQHMTYDRDEEEGCLFQFDDDTDIGPAAILGIGLDVDLSDTLMVSVVADAHTGEDDFASLNVGVGWRF